MNNKKHLLFCFPYAGGTADFYNNLEVECGDNIRFVKLEYSGHGSRMREPLCKSFEDLTSDLFPKMVNVLNLNPNVGYSLMGYSMGSITLFDVLCRISNSESVKAPQRVFIAAHQPQPIRSLRSVPDDGVDEWVKDRTIEFGGVDKRLISNKIFWRIYLPIFRNDYKMIADYDFDSIEFKTNIPATIFFSEEDTPYEEMKEWGKFFVGESEFIEYTGSHFFIETYCRDMADVIKDRLRI